MIASCKEQKDCDGNREVETKEGLTRSCKGTFCAGGTGLHGSDDRNGERATQNKDENSLDEMKSTDSDVPLTEIDESF
jgi:hypothetical protein